MMKKKKEVRAKWLTIRLGEAEEKKLNTLASRTTAQSLSEYARAVLLKEPTIVIYRNGVADDFLREMLELKKELNSLGSNYHQAVRKLLSLDQRADIICWVIQHEEGRKIFLKKVDEILQKLSLIQQLWSQE